MSRQEEHEQQPADDCGQGQLIAPFHDLPGVRIVRPPPGCEWTRHAKTRLRKEGKKE
jgi:hypothetical protein